jgi:hypothetical protein
MAVLGPQTYRRVHLAMQDRRDVRNRVSVKRPISRVLGPSRRNTLWVLIRDADAGTSEQFANRVAMCGFKAWVQPAVTIAVNLSSARLGVPFWHRRARRRDARHVQRRLSQATRKPPLGLPILHARTGETGHFRRRSRLVSSQVPTDRSALASIA